MKYVSGTSFFNSDTKENDFLNEMLPVLKEDIVNCNKAVMESSFVSELKKEVPETYFLQREMEEKSFSFV